MAYDFDFSVLNAANMQLLADGMILSAKITFVGIFFGIVWGTCLALMRLSSLKVLNGFSQAYVTFCRSVPLVMVLLWFFLIVPQILQQLFGLSPASDFRLVSSMVAFSLFVAAYYSEIIRAGIKGVSRGQFAAAQALGMNYAQCMIYIILPQAFKTMVPLLLYQGVILFQDTSLVYVSALSDFFGRAYGIGERDGRIVEMLLVAGGVYFVICFAVSQLVKHLQKKQVRA